MRLVILSVLSLLLTVSAQGQNKVCEFRVDSLSKDTIYTKYSHPPTFGKSKSDDAALYHIGDHYTIPQSFSGSELMVASIIVSENGEVTDIQIIKKSGNPLLNENYVKVLKSMKKWNPAMCDGKMVRAELILPLRLKR